MSEVGWKVKEMLLSEASFVRWSGGSDKHSKAQVKQCQQQFFKMICISVRVTEKSKKSFVDVFPQREMLNAICDQLDQKPLNLTASDGNDSFNWIR
jgi:hypothetical protein